MAEGDPLGSNRLSYSLQKAIPRSPGSLLEGAFFSPKPFNLSDRDGKPPSFCPGSDELSVPIPLLPSEAMVEVGHVEPKLPQFLKTEEEVKEDHGVWPS